ncbi:MAG: 4Fe-4S dicluster domain-containing protein [Caldilineaceae bacterium]|nr:4Fe-4S dicluster domain-containing protein [Caldilineaceae bacterium]
MEPRYGIMIDLTRCVGCQACVVACKTGNELVPGQAYIDIQSKEHGTFPILSAAFLTHRCFHCGDAACVAVCPTGALYKKYRLTAVDEEKCIACERCVKACPFGVPEIIDDHVSKCTGCMELVESGGEPWCVQTCPSGALTFGNRRELMNAALNNIDSIREQFPKAQIYGKTEAGGLSVFLILPDEPTMFDLPSDREIGDQLEELPARPRAEERAEVQQSSLGGMALALGLGGLAALFNRRKQVNRHEIELEIGD